MGTMAGKPEFSIDPMPPTGESGKRGNGNSAGCDVVTNEAPFGEERSGRDATTPDMEEF
jgi:hypothetical protein